MPDREPLVSVIIATRNRGSEVRQAVASVLADAGPDVEVIVIDQSDEPSLALSGFEERVHLRHDSVPGLARARNRGCASARGEYLLFTDDDCTAKPGWIAAMLQPMRNNRNVGLVFGAVHAAPYDRRSGLIPAYRPMALKRVAGVAHKAEIEGIGASMATRRSVWQQIGGFDERLGSGAELRSGEDTDFAVRVLSAGLEVAETPYAVVVHHGFRDWASAGQLIQGYMVGLGAVYGKLLRRSGWHALRPLRRLAWRWAAERPVVDLNHVPPRLPRVFAFVRGFAQGVLSRLDEHGRFVQGGGVGATAFGEGVGLVQEQVPDTLAAEAAAETRSYSLYSGSRR